MVAIADDRHHVSAVVAEMLNGPLAGDIPLVCHEPEKNQHEDADNRADRDAREAPARLLERQEGEDGHCLSISETDLNLGE